MRKILKKRSYFFGYFLLLVQSIFFVTIAIWLLGKQYRDNVQSYFEDSEYRFSLTSVSYSDRDSVVGFLNRYGAENHLLISRTDTSNSRIKIGLAGQAKQTTPSLKIAGQEALGWKDLNKLLNAKNSQSTIGLGNGSINQLKELPSFPLSIPVTIYKLETLTDLLGSVNGTYQIHGIKDRAQYQKLLTAVANETGEKLSTLQNVAGGSSYVDEGILIDALLLAAGLTIIIEISYFIILLVKDLKSFGVKTLLGWTKITLLQQEFRPLEKAALIIAVFTSFVSGFVAMPHNYYLATLLPLLASQLILLVTFIISAAMASLFLVFEKNIDLIKQRFPVKLVSVYAVLLYLAISAGLVAASLYLDQPAKSIANNAKQAQQWEKVANYQILSGTSSGNDGDRAFSDTGSDLNRGAYRLYKELEGKQGAYLVSSDYHSPAWLKDAKSYNYYKSLPNQPFWLMTLSPNYLRKINFKVSNQAVELAKNGVRVYLVSDDIAIDKAGAYLKEAAQDGISKADIQTTFVKERKFKFIKYHPKKELFTWNGNPAYPTNSKNSIILISTSANMNYVEIGNLLVSGLGSSLKFANQKVRKRLVTKKILAKYGLADNEIKYASVRQYIDGLQKSLRQTISWFGMAIAVGCLVLLLILAIILAIYQLSRQELLAVQSFLGYSKLQMYRLPFSLISCVNLLELAVVLLYRSKIGLVLVIAIYILQLITFMMLVKKNQALRITGK